MPDLLLDYHPNGCTLQQPNTLLHLERFAPCVRKVLEKGLGDVKADHTISQVKTEKFPLPGIR